MIVTNCHDCHKRIKKSPYHESRFYIDCHCHYLIGKNLEMQMKFGHKSNLLSCLILSRTLTYCNSFNVRRAPINPKEIAEKYEKSKSMQILAVKTEIHNNNKTNGIGGSSTRCIRHVSVNWQVAR